MIEESELMTILRRRKQLSEIEDNDEDVPSDAEPRTKYAGKPGGQLYKLVRKVEGERGSDNDPETHQDETVNLRHNNSSSYLYGYHQFNRDSHSSVNSRLSGISSSLQSSFSSNSDTSEILSKKNAVKLKAKDSILIKSSRRRKKLTHQKNHDTPDNDTSPAANRSFLWSRGVSIDDKSNKENSTASIDSDVSDELVYYSIDDSDDKGYEELTDSLDNVHVYEHERGNELSTENDIVGETNNDNIYESIDDNLKIHKNDYESDNVSEDNNDEYSGVTYRNKNVDYGSDSNEFGYEEFDKFGSNNRLVSATNKSVKIEDGGEEQHIDNEKYDTTIIVTDEFGSEHYEDVESGLKVISSVNECFQNEVLALQVPIESKYDKCQRRLIGRVNELVQTEVAYVSKLDHVVNDYKAVMKGDGIPLSLSSLLPDQIFSNIEDLRDFHKDVFLPALQATDHSLVALGKVFKDNELEFKMYIRYSRDNKKCIRNVIEHKHFFNLRQSELGQRLDISSYLLEPIQRVPRYKLFLDDLIKTCEKQEEELREDSGIGYDYRASIASYGSSTFYECINFEEPPAVIKEHTAIESLQTAKSMIDKLLRKVDDTVAIENIRGCPINLREQGELLRQDEFTVLDSARRRFHMRCFLFEYMLVFTTINRKHVKDEVFEYHDFIGMKDLGLTPPPEDECHSTFTVWYKKRNNKPYIMDSDTNVKKFWVKDISALLWEQARRDKEMLISSVSRKSSVLSSSSKSSKEPTEPIETEYVIVAPEPDQSVASTRMPGDQCMSDRKKLTKRKIRKKKVNTDIPDTLAFVGRNMNVIWSSLR